MEKTQEALLDEATQGDETALVALAGLNNSREDTRPDSETSGC